jgi:1-phosphofructokinase family hexose kinase
MFVTLTLNPAIDQTLAVRPPLALGSICAVTAETRTPGGKGVNVAKMIAANGKPVTAGGLLGRQELPFYRQSLVPVGIACRFLAVPFPTRVNTMLTDGAGHELKLNKPGFPELAFDEGRLLAYAGRLAKKGMIVILSGSLPARFPADTYARLIRHFRKAGCATVLDTSGPALAAGLAAGPDIIKPNRQELDSVLGRKLKTEKMLKDALADLMIKHEVVILSDGPAGAWFASRGEILFAPSPDVKRIDTTGAGDTLLGQFCADYFPARKLTPALAARAVAAGAAAVEQHGTPVIAMERIRALSGQ